MILRFSERFALPLDEVLAYFATPADWPRLYGFAGAARGRFQAIWELGWRRLRKRELPGR